MLHRSTAPSPQKVVFDPGVLVGNQRSPLIAVVALGYVRGFWSGWIIAEFARARTQWTLQRAARDRCDISETKRRLYDSLAWINAAIRDFPLALTPVDDGAAGQADLSWLANEAERQVMYAALAAGADALVTNNRRDFPVGEVRNHVRILGSREFLAAIYAAYPDAEAAVRRYLRGTPG